MTHTPLDKAHMDMSATPDNDKARLSFFQRLADCELFLMLNGSENSETPLLFDTSDGSYVLAFDTEDRLTKFAEAPAPYAALSGRALALMLEGKGLSLIHISEPTRPY